MNKLFLWLLLCCLPAPLCAQTLFTYGPYKVDKSEFLWAYRKNNAYKGSASLKAYLDLYINYKLKVRAARDAGLDSASDIKRDMGEFRSQLAQQTMRKEEGIGALSREALIRDQTDIEITQVYVGFTSPRDTLGAYNRIHEAQGQLKGGADFATVATAYGTNPYLKASGGYTGYVTVFSLPYDAENIVYGLRDGQYSDIYKSRSGYHIFKRLGERKNPGIMRAAQILLAYAPKADKAEKDRVRAEADALYDSLEAGASFDSLVKRYSNDKMTYYNYGLLPDFTTGDYDPAFEAAAFALPDNGSVSKPVETVYGFHIIKRLGLHPALADSSDSQRWSALQEKVFYSDRMEESKDKFAASILPILKYRSLQPDTAWLYRTTDTLIKSRGGEEYIKKVKVVPLFSLDGKEYTSTDWFRYILYRRPGGPREPIPFYPAAFSTYLHFSALEYYSENLEKYNTEYRYQTQEFMEGTLLFSIMQQEIWNKSTLDSAQQRMWFEQHKDRFALRPSADVIAISALDSATMQSFHDRLEGNISSWKVLLSNYPGLLGDSAHFELNALSLDSSRTAAGMITAPARQPDNRWHSYAILRVYPSRAASSFEEVKGLVMGSYQAHLEQEWLSSLRKKYPISIKTSVLETLKP
jgi:peptidyl-prolyl cis-trans isomerase SurA